MPGFDGTGPMGQGPLTGRQMGYCAGARGTAYRGFGRGLGRGFGRGLGRGFGRFAGAGNAYGAYADPQVYDELTARIEELENELKTLRKDGSQQ